MADRQEIMVYVELKSGGPTTACAGLLREAGRLAARRGCPLSAAVFGPAAAAAGADTLVDIRAPESAEMFPGFHARVLSGVVQDRGPCLVMFAASDAGSELAERVAARLGASFAPGCTSIETGPGDAMTAARGVFGGRLSQLLTLDCGRTNVVTMLPESLPAGGGSPKSLSEKGDSGGYHPQTVFVGAAISGTSAEIHPQTSLGVAPSSNINSQQSLKQNASGGPEVMVIEAAPVEEDERVRLSECEAEGADEMEIQESEIVVSGGRGLKKGENFRLLGELATRLDGAVAGTRGAVDLGWIGRERQVGQTGKTIAPELYIACGLSGAPQHLLGMKNSRRVVAVNRDAGAPIVQAADFAAIGDLFEIIPALIGELDARRRGGGGS